MTRPAAPQTHREVFADPTVPDAADAPPQRPPRTVPWFVLALAGLFLLGVAASALQAAGQSGAAAPAAVKDHGGFFPPRDDLVRALDEARRSGRKGVAVLFEMEGCGECAKLRATTFKDGTLRKWYGEHFVTASLLADHPLPLVDFDGQATEQTEFARRERVFALPTLVFYDLDGLPVTRQLGSAGEVADWLRLGRYVAEQGYEDAPFSHWQPAD
ncbi:thioredoxin family protein [Pseudothauera rhizosphaerae]|uniref:Thioredoxin-like fold domain-containing protein n=1 Tax=Pseudothauera rhizosphaerae TaxID=2565932 RepID=A0A4S4B325_9RHOO|nr:thioredoxin fold domain-containing protein [Pseudothauera rhizosphaerae]THF65311.1 hypothetical protein E6O51_01540 [Pseudothauera rhizosphaerae]